MLKTHNINGEVRLRIHAGRTQTERKTKPVSVFRAASLDVLIQVLCTLMRLETFTFGQFKKEYERITGREISHKTAEDYFHSATKWRLIHREKSRYYVSKNEVKILCEYQREGRELELKKSLFNILKSREPVFFDFLSFIRRKPTLNDLENKFNPHTRRTLLIWANWLGIISKSEVEQRYYLTIRKKTLTSEQFWRVVKAAYEKLRETRLAGVKSAYVKIPNLRDLCCFMKGLTYNEFNKKLGLLLRRKEYGGKIELSGAPVAFIQRELKKKREPFEFNKKKYYFIAIKE